MTARGASGSEKGRPPLVSLSLVGPSSRTPFPAALPAVWGARPARQARGRGGGGGCVERGAGGASPSSSANSRPREAVAGQKACFPDRSLANWPSQLSAHPLRCRFREMDMQKEEGWEAWGSPLAPGAPAEERQQRPARGSGARGDAPRALSHQNGADPPLPPRPPHPGRRTRARWIVEHSTCPAWGGGGRGRSGKRPERACRHRGRSRVAGLVSFSPQSAGRSLPFPLSSPSTHRSDRRMR